MSARKTLRPLSRALLVGVIGLVAAAPMGLAGSAAADPANPNNYNLSAVANSLDVLVNEPGAPLVQTYEVSPYGASASLDSLGQSFADAGAPYSPLVVSLPGLVNGLGAGGRVPPLPPLPGYVSATYPATPSAAQAQAGYEIRATADSGQAKGEVKLGVTNVPTVGSTFSASAVTSANSDGSVSVSASAGVDLLSLAGLVDIGNISSTATMTQQPGKTPTITGSTNLGTVTLLKSTTGLLNGALNVLGTGIPLPLTDMLVPVLNGLLGPAGIKLSILPVTYIYTDGTKSFGQPDSSKTIQSVDSGALKLSIAQNVPSQGLVTVDLTLGRVMLSTTNTPGVAPGTVPPDTGGSTPSSSVPSAQPATGQTTGAAMDTVAPAVPLPPLGSGSSLPIASPGGQDAAVTQRLATIPIAYQKGPSAESLYLMLVIVGLGTVAASLLLRFLSIRLAFSPVVANRV